MTATRAAKFPSIFKQSFFDHNEAVWFPVTGLTWATFILMNVLYGVPYTGVCPLPSGAGRADRQQWFKVACEIMFYIHVVYAVFIQTVMEFTL